MFSLRALLLSTLLMTPGLAFAQVDIGHFGGIVAADGEEIGVFVSDGVTESWSWSGTAWPDDFVLEPCGDCTVSSGEDYPWMSFSSAAQLSLPTDLLYEVAVCDATNVCEDVAWLWVENDGTTGHDRRRVSAARATGSSAR